MTNSCLKCPVTALKCFQNLLITGQKSRIVIYDFINGKKLLTSKVFATSSIHTFRVNKNSILVVGGKSTRLIQITINNTNHDKVNLNFCSCEKTFNGWIWDGISLNETTFALITAHNTVLVWDSATNEHKATSSCEEQCILYSGLIQNIHEEIIVAAGTVFNQLLLWKPNIDMSVPHVFKETWKRFHGHEGVIFRIRFSPNFDQLLSVSDDRSIRVWNIETETCMHVLFGHVARVWDAIFTGRMIVSVGEDAACILWTRSGDIVKKFTGHKGKSIWSMDVNEHSVFTGGGDGAIRQWPLPSESSSSSTTTQAQISNQQYNLPIHIKERASSVKSEADFPKTIKFLDNRNLLIFTNNGLLVRFEEDKNSWNVLFEDTSYSSYSVFELKNGIVGIGNLHGSVKLFELTNPTNFLEEKLFDGKIFSMLFLSCGSSLLLLVTGPEGVIKCFKVDWKVPVKLSLLSQFLLPHSKQRWLTDATAVIDDYNDVTGCHVDADINLVCGDRRGSLHLFNTTSQDPVHSMLGVHGKTGVTSVVYNDGTLYSTGRDGSFRKYNIKNGHIILLDKQKACKGMDWIEGIWFNHDDVIVYGFYMQSHFAMWSFHRNEILFKVQCGGGYRSWDVLFPDVREANPQLKFSYLKGPDLHTVKSKWTMSETCAIIQDKLHGREVLCVKVLGVRKNNTQWLLASSSEDTTINFMIYDTTDNSLHTLHVAVGHIGGVKDIVFVPYHSAKYTTDRSLQGMFISCGSRTALKIWTLKCSGFSTYARDLSHSGDDVVDVTCCISFEIFNPEMNPKQLKLRTGEFIDDMRYLSCDAFELLRQQLPSAADDEEALHVVCCVCACSDGVARVYLFRDDRSPQLLVKLGDNQHCVQQVRFERRENEVFVITTDTSGHCSFWNITSFIRDCLQQTRDNSNDPETNDYTYSTTSIQHVNRKKYKFHEFDNPRYESGPPSLQIDKHQSGINSLDILQTGTGFVVVTGGDDNALCVFMVSKSCENSKYHVTEHNEQRSAHVSSITGVRLANENLVISTSIDQRVKIWDVHDLTRPLCDIFTDVADVSNLEIWKHGETLYVAITGVGMEIIPLNQDIKIR